MSLVLDGTEVILSRRVIRQPEPFVYKHGDCGGCVLAGLFGLTVAQAYEDLNNGAVDAFSWFEMKQALFRAVSSGLADRCLTDYPEWPQWRFPLQGEYGLPGWYQSLAYWHYLTMALDAGYYGIACVNFDRKGPDEPADHWVLLCGARRFKPEDRGAIHQVLVSCSGRSTADEEWVDVHEFLKRWGGFNLLLARPTAAE